MIVALRATMLCTYKILRILTAKRMIVALRATMQKKKKEMK